MKVEDGKTWMKPISDMHVNVCIYLLLTSCLKHREFQVSVSVKELGSCLVHTLVLPGFALKKKRGGGDFHFL